MILNLNCTTFSLRSHKKQVRITFAGDIMCHSSQLASYYDSKTKSYQADKSFDYIAKRIKNSDLVLGNLETTIVSSPDLYSGYPRFGSPKAIVKSLKKTGFHIISTANNHSADKESLGIDLTIDTVLEEGMIPIGTYKSMDDYITRKNLIITLNDIKIAIYNYTYSTNGVKVPKDRIVRLIDEESISKDLAFAKQNQADFIIVWYHFGTEYQIKPDSYQEKWVNFALKNGANIVIGGHPHVVQKIERYNLNKDSLSDEQFIAYSLGNFLSAQSRPFTDGGMLLHFNILIEENGKRTISDIKPEPVWVSPNGYRIIPIEAYLNNEMEIQLSPNHKKRMLNYYKEFQKVMNDNKI
ncbi:MAG: CapA family protein [Leptospira sp.]|nr:CapA family protein [Leptospira sp.]